MDKVQKIREEVARIQLYTQSEVLKQVLDYIDEVQKEEIPPKFPLISQKKCMYTKDHYTDEDRKVLCDGCEEECKYAQKEEPVSEELEEASKEWIRPQLDKSYAAYGETKQMELTHFDGYAMLDAIEFGAKWKKEQMMAKAVDGVITFDYYGNDNKTYGCIAHDSFCLEDIGLKDTDKVKMIIVKDEMS